MAVSDAEFTTKFADPPPPQGHHQTRSTVWHFDELVTPFGTYKQITIEVLPIYDGLPALSGTGTSRDEKRAMAYALEDLAQKVRNS